MLFWGSGVRKIPISYHITRWSICFVHLCEWYYIKNPQGDYPTYSNSSYVVVKLGCSSCGFLSISNLSYLFKGQYNHTFAYFLSLNFFYRMPPKKLKFEDTCSTCGLNTNHLKRHVLRIHMPWFMNPVTACIDCQTYEGCGKQLSRFHGRHQLISGEALI